MKFTVGYQLNDQDPFVDIVRDYRDHICEVYFPWLTMPSGRASLSSRRGYVDWSAQERLETDLTTLKDMGVRLDLLFNANCYGGRAVSVSLANEVCSVIDRLADVMGGVDVVTTTSPAVAHIIRSEYDTIRIRASVNMRIGTVQGMEYVAHLFDEYCVQREYNRSLERLAELKAWAATHGKALCLLVNSGCMNHCSGQSFHDNLVAHEQDVDETEKLGGFMPHMCWQFLKDRSHWIRLLQNSWLRPEDLHRYKGIIDSAKLATRMHVNARMVINAFVSGRFAGNLLDLFEPGHGPALAPWIIDNTRFPEDWFEHALNCRGEAECGECQATLDRVLVNVGDG